MAKVTPEDMERARRWLRHGPLEHADYTGDPLEVEANLAAEFAAVRAERDAEWDNPGRGPNWDTVRQERTAEIELIVEEVSEAGDVDVKLTCDEIIRRLREKP